MKSEKERKTVKTETKSMGTNICQPYIKQIEGLEEKIKGLEEHIETLTNTLFDISFKFVGTIRRPELKDRLIEYLRPWWDDEPILLSNSGLLFDGSPNNVNRNVLDELLENVEEYRNNRIFTSKQVIEIVNEVIG